MFVAVDDVEYDRYKVFTSSKHHHTNSSPPSLDSFQLNHEPKQPQHTNSFHPTQLGQPVNPTKSTASVGGSNYGDPVAVNSHRRTQSATPISRPPNQSTSSHSTEQLHHSQPRTGGPVGLNRPATEYSATRTPRRPSPTYQATTTRRPSQLPKPLDNSNSFAITLNDKAGKRELRSAYATQGSTISICTTLRPDKLSFALTNTTTTDKDGNQQTTWQISLTPTEPEARSSLTRLPSSIDRPPLQAYHLSSIPNSSDRPHPDSAPTSPRSTGLGSASRASDPKLVVKVMEPTPVGLTGRWSGSEMSFESSAGPNRQQAALALARGGRRMMSKWSDTEGESDNDKES